MARTLWVSLAVVNFLGVAANSWFALNGPLVWMRPINLTTAFLCCSGTTVSVIRLREIMAGRVASHTEGAADGK